MRAVYGGPYRPGHGGGAVRRPWRGCAAATSGGCSTGDGHRHHHLDLRAVPEVAAAQRAWRRPPAPRPPPTPIRRGCSPWPTRWSARGGSRPALGQEGLAGPAAPVPAGTPAGVLVVAGHRPRRGGLPETVALAGALLDPVMHEEAGWQTTVAAGRYALPAGRGVLRANSPYGWSGRGWPPSASPAAGNGGWAGPCSPGAAVLHGRVHRIRRGQHIPTVRAGPVVAPREHRPVSARVNCAPWPNRSPPRAEGTAPRGPRRRTHDPAPLPRPPRPATARTPPRVHRPMTAPV